MSVERSFGFYPVLFLIHFHDGVFYATPRRTSSVGDLRRENPSEIDVSGYTALVGMLSPGVSAMNLGC